MVLRKTRDIKVIQWFMNLQNMILFDDQIDIVRKKLKIVVRYGISLFFVFRCFDMKILLLRMSTDFEIDTIISRFVIQ